MFDPARRFRVALAFVEQAFDVDEFLVLVWLHKLVESLDNVGCLRKLQVMMLYHVLDFTYVVVLSS